MKALLFGSIGVIVDASHLQFQAYNRAFDEVGLDWKWQRDEYERLLDSPGGKARLRQYGQVRDGQAPDEDLVARVHGRKGELFQEMLLEGGLSARPGVSRLMEECAAAGIQVGLVTSTELGNVRATLEAAGPAIRLDRFDVVTHRDVVPASKPDAGPWRYALDKLGIDPPQAVAVEDTGACVDSARAAGLVTVATPNTFAGTQDFSDAQAIVDCLGDRDTGARQLAGASIVVDGLVSLERLAELTSAAA